MVIRKHLRKLIAAVAVVILLLIGAALLLPHQVLVIDDGQVHADAIVLLGGGAGERPARVAELFRDGAAPKVLVSGAGDADGNRLLLMHRGVPSGAISLEPDSRTTRENALLSIPLLRAMGARKIIIVTSWYHSRRSLKCFRHYAPDLVFYSCPSYHGFNRSDWSQEHLRRRIRAEYTKLAGYWLLYGVCPF
ncbi:MAG TPA: YdcF family protein [Patescibacteria group bacterium]|nr:YdcF family protein [Patescibacteria group bacterium]